MGKMISFEKNSMFFRITKAMTNDKIVCLGQNKYFIFTHVFDIRFLFHLGQYINYYTVYMIDLCNKNLLSKVLRDLWGTFYELCEVFLIQMLQYFIS